MGPSHKDKIGPRGNFFFHKSQGSGLRPRSQVMAGPQKSLPREPPAPFLCTLTRSPSSHSKPRPSWTMWRSTRVCTPTQRPWASRCSTSPAWGSSRPQPIGRLDQPSISGQMGNLSPIRTLPHTRHSHGDISPLGKRQVCTGDYPFLVDERLHEARRLELLPRSAGQSISRASKPLVGGITAQSTGCRLWYCA